MTIKTDLHTERTHSEELPTPEDEEVPAIFFENETIYQEMIETPIIKLESTALKKVERDIYKLGQLPESAIKIPLSLHNPMEALTVNFLTLKKSMEKRDCLQQNERLSNAESEEEGKCEGRQKVTKQKIIIPKQIQFFKGRAEGNLQKNPNELLKLFEVNGQGSCGESQDQNKIEQILKNISSIPFNQAGDQFTGSTERLLSSSPRIAVQKQNLRALNEKFVRNIAHLEDENAISPYSPNETLLNNFYEAYLEQYSQNVYSVHTKADMEPNSVKEGASQTEKPKLQLLPSFFKNSQNIDERESKRDLLDSKNRLAQNNPESFDGPSPKLSEIPSPKYTGAILESESEHGEPGQVSRRKTTENMELKPKLGLHQFASTYSGDNFIGSNHDTKIVLPQPLARQENPESKELIPNIGFREEVSSKNAPIQTKEGAELQKIGLNSKVSYPLAQAIQFQSKPQLSAFYQSDSNLKKVFRSEPHVILEKNQLSEKEENHMGMGALRESIDPFKADELQRKIYITQFSQEYLEDAKSYHDLPIENHEIFGKHNTKEITSSEQVNLDSKEERSFINSKTTIDKLEPTPNSPTIYPEKNFNSPSSPSRGYEQRISPERALSKEHFIVADSKTHVVRFTDNLFHQRDGKAFELKGPHPTQDHSQQQQNSRENLFEAHANSHYHQALAILMKEQQELFQNQIDKLQVKYSSLSSDKGTHQKSIMETIHEKSPQEEKFSYNRESPRFCAAVERQGSLHESRSILNHLISGNYHTPKQYMTTARSKYSTQNHSYRSTDSRALTPSSKESPNRTNEDRSNSKDLKRKAPNLKGGLLSSEFRGESTVKAGAKKLDRTREKQSEKCSKASFNYEQIIKKQSEALEKHIRSLSVDRGKVTTFLNTQSIAQAQKRGSAKMALLSSAEKNKNITLTQPVKQSRGHFLAGKEVSEEISASKDKIAEFENSNAHSLNLKNNNIFLNLSFERSRAQSLTHSQPESRSSVRNSRLDQTQKESDSSFARSQRVDQVKSNDQHSNIFSSCLDIAQKALDEQPSYYFVYKKPSNNILNKSCWVSNPGNETNKSSLNMSQRIMEEIKRRGSSPGKFSVRAVRSFLK